MSSRTIESLPDRNRHPLPEGVKGFGDDSYEQVAEYYQEIADRHGLSTDVGTLTLEVLNDRRIRSQDWLLLLSNLEQNRVPVSIIYQIIEPELPGQSPEIGITMDFGD